MIALKMQPYPTTGLDLSLFEDDTGDYGPHVPAIYPEFVSARSPCHILAKLVRDGEIEDAERVIQELVELDFPIQEDMIYERAAFATLRTTTRPSQDRVNLFIGWFSLIPPAKSLDELPSFSALQYALMSRPPLSDIPLIMEFVTTAASKGYISSVAVQVIPHMIRYTTPTVSSSFMKHIMKADLHYFQSLDKKFALSDLMQRWKIYYGLAIRIHCASGRPQDAFDLYKAARKLGVPISSFTSQYLSAALNRSIEVNGKTQATGDGDVREEENIWTQAMPSAFCAPPEDPPFEDPSPPESIPDMSPVTQDFTRPNLSKAQISSLALSLRSFKSSLNSKDPPNASELAQFIGTCAMYHRLGAIRALRLCAYRSSQLHLSVSVWGLAEMLHYLYCRDRKELLIAFVRHFHVVGVPKRVVKFAERIVGEDGWGPEFGETLESILPTGYPLPRKLSPSSHHTALVWRACVQSTRTPAELEVLYKELLTQIAISRASTFEAHTAAFPAQTSAPSWTVDYPEWMKPIPMPILFDSAHFNTFIYAFAQRMGPSRATSVVLDMYRLGIQPSVQTLTVLASGFARAGDMEHLLRLLERMEQSPVYSSPASSSPSSPSSPSPPSSSISSSVAPEEGGNSSDLPSPNEVTYTAIIRWLMNTKRLEDAKTIAMRLFKQGGYVRGTNAITDSVLAELEIQLPDVARLGTSKSTQL